MIDPNHLRDRAVDLAMKGETFGYGPEEWAMILSAALAILEQHFGFSVHAEVKPFDQGDVN